MKKTLKKLLLAIVLLFLMWAAVLGFPRIYLGPYALDVIDALNLWYEEKKQSP